jgi:hypothetical protein
LDLVLVAIFLGDLVKGLITNLPNQENSAVRGVLWSVEAFNLIEFFAVASLFG